MVSWLAYLGLGLSLLSMSMKHILPLRILHILSSSLYGLYGYFIEAAPLVVGAVSFIGIHLFHIVRLVWPDKR